MIHNFTKNEFINNFIDIDDDVPCVIYIVNNPSKGTFQYEELTVSAPLELNMCDIDKLSYIVNTGESGMDTFNFYIIDSNKTNPKKSNMATFTISIEERENLPPDAVGDQSITTSYNTPVIITYAMLITNTTPPYNDPESDPPYQLKVLSLPNSGQLMLSGVPVTANQNINFTDINLGNFTYNPDSGNINQHTTSWTFAISDTGSQQFTS